MSNSEDLARRQQAAALYRAGLTLRAIAAQMGVSYQAVHKLLVKAGVERRPRGGNTGSHSRH